MFFIKVNLFYVCEMLITKEQQEALVDKYIREKNNQDECIGFIDGLAAMLELIERLDKNGK